MIRRAALCLLITALAAPAQAQTLVEAIADAYASNPELAEAGARQDALAEAPEQARAAGRPTVELDAGLQTGTGDRGDLTVTSRLPLWTGGRVSAAIRTAEAEVDAGRERLREREAAVLESVVSAYADILFAQEAERIARIGIERLDRQVEEAQVRFDSGQATLTDVAQLEAQRAGIVGSLADAQAALGRARADYLAVVGQEPEVLESGAALPRALPPDLASARTIAEAENPRLLERAALSAAARARIGAARAERAPNLDLLATGGQASGLGGGGIASQFERFGTVGVAFRLPLLTGGFVPSRIREAQANARAEEFAVDAARREAIRATDGAWASLRGAQQRLEASRQALQSAEIALNGVRAEYELGLRNTLDLLIAEQSLRAAELDVARSRSDVMLAEARLLRAVGRLTGRAYVDRD
ncbi:type I secretion protein TolC [Porphyrobacter sp. TH134]|uniref:TolC family outer membrane protein n=1 Tax=Porphyrobacter sp. TH134 TaxID=2067450 RepID=UPI000C7BE3B3|nr:TolC family outer membrane protein [Porphyrobacter sp. TH134]PLK22593.1 type I secretion protein TolC [Porphyrobacter sp. TH134]